jgi:glyoxylase-like metal-dependent hydrolase (beta-lactamase superfamily II)
MKGSSVPVFNRFKLGAFEVTTLLSGTRTVDNPTEIFGLNADPAEFAAVSQAAFIPTDKAQFFFTPTLVNTGAELVLFDAGLSQAGITAALAAAGYTPDQIDVVVLTHMHGDHIGGLMGDAGPTFANARYVTGSAEHNHWMAAGNEGFDKNVRPLNDRMTFLDDGGSVAGGLTAMLAAGHTPGHMGYVIESEGQSLALIADLANHFGLVAGQARLGSALRRRQGGRRRQPPPGAGDDRGGAHAVHRLSHALPGGGLCRGQWRRVPLCGGELSDDAERLIRRDRQKGGRGPRGSRPLLLCGHEKGATGFPAAPDFWPEIGPENSNFPVWSRRQPLSLAAMSTVRRAW